MTESMDNNSKVIPRDIDAILAAELNEMTFYEREKIYEELHGVLTEIEETNDLLETSLQQLDQVLQKLPNRAIYERAREINSHYVEDRSFRLMFLRSEYFHAEKAAIRLLKFLENKVKFFGQDTLARPIYLTDFNDDDMRFLKGGIIQLIPVRDQSGRVIVADFNMDPNIEQPKHIDNYIRTVVYTLLAAAEDVETQKRGVIGLFYFTNAVSTVKQLFERRPKIFDWVPLKAVAGHFCFEDSRFRVMKALLMVLMGKERRVRVRVHEGSHTECQYKLMTFGLPVRNFPVTYEGELKTSSHLTWLARRKTKEKALEAGKTFHGIDIPGKKDALFGRGKVIQDYSGNVLMRNLIAQFMSEYRRVAKKGKGKVISEVMDVMKALGCRFLKRDASGWWVEVSDETAREKISMTFRTSRSKIVPQERIMASPQSLHYGAGILERDTKKPKRHESDGNDCIDYSLGSSSQWLICYGV